MTGVSESAMLTIGRDVSADRSCRGWVERDGDLGGVGRKCRLSPLFFLSDLSGSVSALTSGFGVKSVRRFLCLG